MITGLNYPVAFTFTPDGRFLITMKPGTIRMYSSTGTFMNVFYDMADSTYNLNERGLLGIEIDPNYASNAYVYVYYIHRCCVSTTQTGPQYIRIVRFTEVGNVGTNPTIIFEHAVGNIPGFHVAGNLRFRPSDPSHIYFTIGDVGTQTNAQLLTNPYGKVLRINKYGSIPTSNPFYDDGNPAVGNCDYIWDYGHRNPFDLCASTTNDSLYYSENGTSAANQGDDEVGMIVRGRNHGWPTCEAFDNYGTNTPCSNMTFLPPIAPMPPVTATMPAITGIMYYSSNVFPTLTNHLLVADINFGRITDITLGNPPYYDTALSSQVWADFTNNGFTTLKQGSDGCVYAMEGPYSTGMRLHRICPVPATVSDPAPLNIAFHDILPNPAAETFTLNWTMQADNKVIIEIYDINGKKLNTLLNEKRAKFDNTLDVHRSDCNLKNGVYLVKFIVSDEKGVIFSQTRELILVK